MDKVRDVGFGLHWGRVDTAEHEDVCGCGRVGGSEPVI